MRRKRIAIYANGWGIDCIQEVGHSILQAAKQTDMDVFAFVDYSSHSEPDEIKLKEFNIFKLPNIEDFDGVIAFANSFNSHYETEYVQEILSKSKVPSISLEYKLDGVDYIGSDDYSGMRALVEHMLVDHGAKEIIYMGGIKEHPANIIRFKALIDVASECGVVIPDENILYGDFSAIVATNQLEEWSHKHEKMPDAIICANDNMAIGVCDWLKDKGYRVPEDVKVTGFDCISQAQQYDPVITSVNRVWSSLGDCCINKLIKKINGETVSSEEEVKTSLVCGGSCGCKGKNHNTLETKIRRKSVDDSKIDGFAIDQHFRHMYLAVRRNATQEDLNNNLSYFFKYSEWLEGRKVAVAFYPDFFYLSESSNNRLKQNGYPDEMDLVCFTVDGNKEDYCRMKTNEIIFKASEQSEEPGVYMFIPIRNDEMNFGFAMLTKGFSIVQDNILYIWTRHMNQYSEQIRSNIMINQLTKRLEMLSVTDKLTDVYNRTGCESIIFEKLDHCQLEGGQSVVMIVDLDGLKAINDVYGHPAGDKAIKMAADIMKKELSDQFLISRFGGDEFLIGGVFYEKIDLDSIANLLIEKCKATSLEMGLPYEISMSIGAIQLDKGVDFHAVECIQIADKLMYKMKEEHHKRNK